MSSKRVLPMIVVHGTEKTGFDCRVSCFGKALETTTAESVEALVAKLGLKACRVFLVASNKTVIVRS